MRVLVKPVVTVQTKHHWLVRWTHWLNIPLLLGLSITGISIYWASPIYRHLPDSITGNDDYLADLGMWLCNHIYFLKAYPDPPNWVYNHTSLGPAVLAPALRLHWLFAYLFMVNGGLYVAGLLGGGGFRSLLPRRRDISEAFGMARYYALKPFSSVQPKRSSHPSKYNALQRGAYLSVSIAGALSVLTGWAIHKPVQFGWVASLFGGYDAARVWHFWLMWYFLLFTIPHVFMVLADGWDTLRSMVVGRSERLAEHDE